MPIYSHISDFVVDGTTCISAGRGGLLDVCRSFASPLEDGETPASQSTRNHNAIIPYRIHLNVTQFLKHKVVVEKPQNEQPAKILSSRL